MSRLCKHGILVHLQPHPARPMLIVPKRMRIPLPLLFLLLLLLLIIAITCINLSHCLGVNNLVGFVVVINDVRQPEFRDIVVCPKTCILLAVREQNTL